MKEGTFLPKSLYRNKTIYVLYDHDEELWLIYIRFTIRYSMSSSFQTVLAFRQLNLMRKFIFLSKKPSLTGIFRRLADVRTNIFILLAVFLSFFSQRYQHFMKGTLNIFFKK